MDQPNPNPPPATAAELRAREARHAAHMKLGAKLSDYFTLDPNLKTLYDQLWNWPASENLCALILQILVNQQKEKDTIMAAIDDLTAAVTALKASTDAAVAKIKAQAAELAAIEPTVVQATADITAASTALGSA